MRFLSCVFCAFFMASVVMPSCRANVVSTQYVTEKLSGKADTATVTSELAKKQDVGDYALKSELPTVPSNVSELNNDSGFITNAALTDYAKTADVNAAVAVKADTSALTTHTGNTANPHSVTKAQVGLANVQNVDQTNANNLTSGTVAYGRLPVGTVASTVAAGDDVRFSTIPTEQPSGTPPSGQVYIWFN